MTLILGAKDPESGRTYVCCDSQSTWGDYFRATDKNYSKAFTFGNVIIGVTGPARDGDIIYANIEKLGLTCEITFNTMVSEVVPAIFSLMDENGRLLTGDTGKELQCEIMVATKDSIYSIFYDGCVVSDLNGFLSLGKSWDAAHIGFEVLKDQNLPVWISLLKIAYSICSHDNTVDFPICLLAVGHPETYSMDEAGCKKLLNDYNKGVTECPFPFS